VYGTRRADLEAVLSRRSLDEEMSHRQPDEEVLDRDVRGKPPEEGLTGIPYRKGALFLRTLEERYGRDALDKFLRGYFAEFAFQSMSTERFVQLAERQLGTIEPLGTWVYKPGVPPTAAVRRSEALEEVDRLVERWVKGESLGSPDLSPQQ